MWNLSGITISEHSDALLKSVHSIAHLGSFTLNMFVKLSSHFTKRSYRNSSRDITLDCFTCTAILDVNVVHTQDLQCVNTVLAETWNGLLLFSKYIFLTKLLTIWLYLCLRAGLHVIGLNTKHYRHGMWTPEFKFFKNNFRNSSSSVFTFVGKSIIKLLVLWWSCNKLSLSSRKHSAQRIYHFNL